MPNHVLNVLKFQNLKQDDIEFILNAITTPDFSCPTKLEMRMIDFNSIIPEPQTKDVCPDDCLVNKDSHITIDEDRPWFDWYEWHIKHWGTKWNAYDTKTKIGKNYINFIFSTAWSVPIPVIEQLRLMEYNFTLDYADEDLRY